MVMTKGWKTQHTACPCGKSSDGFSVSEDGWGHCFSANCDKPPNKASRSFKPGSFEGSEPTAQERPIFDDDIADVGNKPRPIEPLPDAFRGWPDRKLTKDTLEKYKVWLNPKPNDGGPVARYPLHDREGKHVGNKTRLQNKSFPQEGVLGNLGLFGAFAFPAGSAKEITITEGQDDAMAVYEMQGRKYPAVSVHSASTAERDIRRNFEYLSTFEKVVICFDNDEAGREAAERIKKLPFKPGTLRVVTLQKWKDAGDYLANGDANLFTKEWWQGPVVTPDGIKMGAELYDEIMNRQIAFTTSYPWAGLTKMTYGLRLSEAVIVTADTKIGKTSFLKHIEHKLLTDPEIQEKGYGVGFMHLEEPNGDTALGLLSIHNGVPYHLPDVERPPEDIRAAFDAVLNTDRCVVWDHFGSHTVDAVLDKVRLMHAMGCRYIVLDHLSIVVSDQAGDERKQLDEIMTKLKTLCMELDICLIAVIHTNRAGQIRGTAGVEQLANIVIRLKRDKMDMNEWRRNVTEVYVTENRFCGETGLAGCLFYDKHTTRMLELSEEDTEIFMQGGQGDEPWD